MSKENDEEFQYVVERKEQDPICFGSKIPRDTNLIGKALSSFQKRQVPENHTNIGPGHYGAERFNTALGQNANKVRSTKGIGPLASCDPRFKTKIFMRIPSPTRYNVAAPPVPRTSVCPPFGFKVGRNFDYDDKLPGPGTYPIARRKCRKTRFMWNLGRPCMVPTIEIFCTNKPTDTCLRCGKLCEGDYWHKDHAIFLCHRCWEEERFLREIFKEKEFGEFKKIRNCSFAHSHEGTFAAVRLMPKRKVHKKLHLENYLDLFLKC